MFAVGLLGMLFDHAGGKVKPLLFAFGQCGQTGPFQNPRLIAIDAENGLGRRAIEEMHAAAGALAFEAKTTHAMARNSSEIILATIEREEDQLHEPFGAAGEMTPQAQQPLAVFAESVEADFDLLAVRPQDLVPFELNGAPNPVP